VSGIVGGPLAGFIMIATDGLYGLQGWQYLFLIEGVPAVVLGVVAYFYLANDPSDAGWLSPSERTVVVQGLATVPAIGSDQPRSFAMALRDKRVWGLTLTYFLFYCVENALLVWIPTLLRSVESISVMAIGWFGGAISVVSMIGMLVISFSSDRLRERRWHVIGCGSISGATFLLLPLAATSLAMTTIILMVASIAVFAFLALFWTIPSAYLRGTSAAGGLAFISSVGALGGVVSPIYIGWMKDLTGSFYGALGSLGLLLLLGMVVLYACLRDAAPAPSMVPV
jgi:sugar phosphate permease